MPKKDKSVLGNIPLHQQDTLIAWLVEDRVPFPDAIDRLWQDFRVKTSRTALDNFWHKYCAPRLLRRSAEAADGFAEQAGGLGENWSAPSKAMVRQKYFELLASPNPNPKELSLFAEMISAVERAELEKAKLDFNVRKHMQTTALKTQELALQREKFEWDAAKKAIEHAAAIKSISTNRALDSDARVEQVRLRLFGEQPKGAT